MKLCLQSVVILLREHKVTAIKFITACIKDKVKTYASFLFI